MVQKPADHGTLSAAEGEALIARVHQSHLGADDAGIVEWVIRMYCWMAFALQEAKRSMQRLRAVFFGQSRKAKTPPEPEASSTSSEALGEGASGGAVAPVAEAASRFEAVECEAEAGASEDKASPKPTGGPRPGTGRLRAEASVGAERTACRHEALAVGQRCPVCGHGTFYELPPGVERRIDGHALLSAMR
jgi:hypothetical protein